MRNLKMWKRLLAVGMCSAMMLSVPMGVSANDPETTGESKETEAVPSITGTGMDSSIINNQPVTEELEKVIENVQKENETQANSRENNKKTKIALEGPDLSDIKPPLESCPKFKVDEYGNVTGNSIDFYVYGESPEVIADVLDLKVVKATADEIDITNAVAIQSIKTRVCDKFAEYQQYNIHVEFGLNVDVLKTSNIKKREESYDFIIELLASCKNDVYEFSRTKFGRFYALDYLFDGKSDSGSDSDSQYVTSDEKINKERMKELVEINKEKDIIINTPSGLFYVFKKGDFNLVDDKDTYDFSISLNTDFSKSGVNNLKVTSDDYIEGINYSYSGKLPGKAEISIPVADKWNNKIFYYYQCKSDGTLEDTGISGVVGNGLCKVSQSHCSDYVLLTKSPKELEIVEIPKPTENDNNIPKPTENTNGSTSNTTNGQPTKTNTKITSPKTGDTSTVLLFIILCMGACVAGTGAVAVRCRSN